MKRYPGFNRDIVSFGLVKDVHLHGADVHISLAVTTNDPNIPAEIHKSAVARISASFSSTSRIGLIATDSRQGSGSKSAGQLGL